MYENLKKLIIFFACLMFTACVHTRHVPDATILEHQRQIDRTEEELRNRDRAINNAIRELEAISSRSESMGGEIEDIIRELDLYHAAVRRLLQAAGYREEQEQDTVQDTY